VELPKFQIRTQGGYKMRYFLVPVLAGLFFLLGLVAARAEPTPGEIDRIDAATRVFDQMPGMIPAFVLHNAKGIAVIPGEVKAGFIFGGELGGGVLVSRLPDGSWSPPAFISVAGGSFGLQIGGEVRDIVLVFNTNSSMANIENGRINLGGDVSVAAGPAGADMGVTATNIPQVYSYVRSAGAFIGATVAGSVLSFDFNSNRDLYGTSDPLRMQARGIPAPALRFTCAVTRATGARSRVCG